MLVASDKSICTVILYERLVDQHKAYLERWLTRDYISRSFYMPSIQIILCRPESSPCTYVYFFTEGLRAVLYYVHYTFSQFRVRS